MKKITLLVCSIFFALAAIAQQNVQLNINHFLGASPFAFNASTTNNLGNTLNFTRLEYYIGQFVLIHDGGQETSVPSTWVLVNAGSPTVAVLGSHNITTLEAIRLSVGVEPTANHSDPASYPASHPLAPKSPSMHWGWAAGYRFVAAEGECGAGLGLNFEIHALGDANLHTFTIATAGTTSGPDLTITLNADYNMALKNVDVSTGTIMHGETGIAADVLVNFSRDVFTSSEGNNSVSIDENKNLKISVGPNPSTGTITVTNNQFNGETVQVLVTDLTGKTIKKTSLKEALHLTFERSGIYFISLLKNGETLAVEKIVIAK